MSKPKKEKQIEVPDGLIKELLTDSEWRMVKQRFLIIRLIESGFSIRKIAVKAMVGTDTVMRVIRMIEKRPKIRQFLKMKTKTGSIKWVFGQGEY